MEHCGFELSENRSNSSAYVLLIKYTTTENSWVIYLEGKWCDGIVHDLSEAESQHEDDQEFSVHRTQRDPQVSAA